MPKPSHESSKQPELLTSVETIIFGSRWIQAPLYFGLIAAQVVYAIKFMIELWHLVTSGLAMRETEAMLMIIGLVDAVMVANLILMIIVGGYETFVSRLYIEDHPDKPEWIDHVDAGVLKVKLAMALVTISSIHLLKTFIDIERMKTEAVVSQIAIHIAFLISLFVMANVEKMFSKPSH